MQNLQSIPNPQSIEELLDRDPLALTEEELAETKRILVTALREERKIWELEKQKSKITGVRVSGNTTKKLQKAAVLEKIKNAPVSINLSALMGKKP